MSWNSKVIWSEGMFLQPQHFQQHDRYLQSQIELRSAGLRPYGWGFSSLEIDEPLLSLGKISLTSCIGVFPDGTPISLPSVDEIPTPIDVSEDVRDAVMVLALPLKRPGVIEADGDLVQDNLARYQPGEWEVRDSNAGMGGSSTVQVGKLRLRLALEKDVVNAHTTLGIARIIERRADNRIVLDPDYCPPCLDFKVARRLAVFATEIVGLLHQRGASLASRLAQPGASGVAEIADFLLLQLLNRSEPLFSHFSTLTGLHPESLYGVLVQLGGELSTFSHPDKRPSEYPVYRHDRLWDTFRPVIEDLRNSLGMVMDPHAISIVLEARKFGVHVAVIPDAELLRTATFVLAVKAQIPAESVRRGFPAQVKLGPVEGIRDLVNLQLPGITLHPLPVAPRQLPFHAGFTYFELDRENEYWKQLTTSAGFALHIAGSFPGLEMEFWAIRK